MRARTCLSIVLPVLIAILAAAGASDARAQDLYRVRGTLKSVAADHLVITSREGEVMGFQLNPKLGVFFVVFLPQFIPAGAPVGRLSLALATLQAAEAALWYSLLGRTASAARALLARPSVRRRLDRITAVVFFGFSLRLAVENHPW